MYRDFGVPRHTRSNLRSSGPSDQPADRANHSRTIFPSEIQRITGINCTGVPCWCSHRSIAQSISLLSPATPSLSSDLPYPAIASFQTTTERSPSSYKAKNRPVSAFSPLYLAGNGPRFASATEASYRRFSLVSHQRPSRPPPSEPSTSDLPGSTIGWPEISPENLPAANSSRACATRAASGIFVIFREIRGYFTILPIH